VKEGSRFGTHIPHPVYHLFLIFLFSNPSKLIITVSTTEAITSEKRIHFEYGKAIAMFTQFAPVSDAISVVNSRCLEIIAEIASSGRLASTDFVLKVLLQRFGVVDFSQLNVGKITDVPSLFLLLEIHNKVRSNDA
jgi:hypothetical protein